ncbi:MAG TPA: DUF3179 domain-containing (seleno)protein [Methylomirabilota bacterium]|nr:DUF3179 domain-containing (seleno)protein [Methylomirabilota bacterium]
MTADRAGHMEPDDAVLGFEVAGRAWAVPWWIMKNHHLANLTLEGQPVMVVLCEACAGASLFDAILDGTRYAFRVEGKYNATHILIDAETGSLWTPFDGRAIHGPRLGTRLRRLPLYQGTWREWTAVRPATLVPDGAGESRAGHGSEHPNPLVGSTPGFADRTRARRDPRLPDIELVLGVEVGGRSRAYPLARLHRAGEVLHDELGGVALVVFTKPGSWLSVAFERTVGGRPLAFRGLGDGMRFADTETGSWWDITGHAVSGPLAGQALRFVPSGIEKWYAWAASHPDTEVYEPLAR